jgi:hypothetical protein
MHVEAGVEARRVAEGPDVAPRAREDGHVPAVSRELQRERASDVRRAATWGEEERAEDATTTHEPSVSVSSSGIRTSGQATKSMVYIVP